LCGALRTGSARSLIPYDELLFPGAHGSTCVQLMSARTPVQISTATDYDPRVRPRARSWLAER